MASCGMKQVDLIRAAEERGQKLGKSQVSQYVSGKTLPRRDVLEILSGILGTTPEWFLGELNESGESEKPDTEADSDAFISLPVVDSADESVEGDGSGASVGQDGGKSEANFEQSRSRNMREFKKSSKLDNVLYDVRGPVADEAHRMEEAGTHILKLNIGNPAPFGFRTPDEVIYDLRRQLTEPNSGRC